MKIYIDNFHRSKDGMGREKLTNTPFQPMGLIDIKVYDQEKEREYIKMNTGIIYERPTTYIDSSPYGWGNLHESFILNSLLKKQYSKFDIDCKYDLAVFNTVLRQYVVNNDKTNLSFTDQLIADIKYFENQQRLIYTKFNMEEELDHVYNVLKTHGNQQYSSKI